MSRHKIEVSGVLDFYAIAAQVLLYKSDYGTWITFLRPATSHRGKENINGSFLCHFSFVLAAFLITQMLMTK